MMTHTDDMVGIHNLDFHLKKNPMAVVKDGKADFI